MLWLLPCQSEAAKTRRRGALTSTRSACQNSGRVRRERARAPSWAALTPARLRLSKPLPVHATQGRSCALACARTFSPRMVLIIVITTIASTAP